MQTHQTCNSMNLPKKSQLHDQQVLDKKRICVAMVERDYFQGREVGVGLCTWTSDIVYSRPPVPSTYAYSASSGIWMILRLEKQNGLAAK